MRNKAYDPKLKKKYDPVGKTLTEEILRDLVGAKKITDNLKEDRGNFKDGFWDQRYELPTGQQILVESEMKNRKWWGEHHHPDRPFEYEDIDIPFRKEKNKSHLHIVISTCKKFAFLLTRKAMNDHLESNNGEPKIKRTIYEPGGAPYFSTPVDRGIFVVNNGKWKRWKKPKSGSGT